MSDRTLFAVPHDDARAAELALRDAKRSREAWAVHGIARRRLDRDRIAHTARLLEARVVETANTLIARARREGER